MSIKIGDKIPSVKIKRLGAEGMEEVDTADVFGGKKVVMFSVPGAYTPTCSSVHLPGFVDKAADLKARGVDDIVCLAVNDPFVMKAWGAQLDPNGAVSLLPDGNGAFTSALGLEMDGSGAGLGTRGKRFSLIANDGVVEQLDVEDVASEVAVSGADSCLAKLG